MDHLMDASNFNQTNWAREGSHTWDNEGKWDKEVSIEHIYFKLFILISFHWKPSQSLQSTMQLIFFNQPKQYFKIQSYMSEFKWIPINLLNRNIFPSCTDRIFFKMDCFLISHSLPFKIKTHDIGTDTVLLFDMKLNSYFKQSLKSLYWKIKTLLRR